MESKIIYGTKNGSFDGSFIEAFFDASDRHLGVNWTHNKRAEVYHFLLNEKYTFDEFVEFLQKHLAGCVDITDAYHSLNLFFDHDERGFLEEYPEYVQEMRSEDEICEYLDEAFDRVWLVRKQDLFCNLLMGEECIHVDVLDRCNKAINEICKKYDIDFKEPVSDWDYGYWSGILAALRWVLGDEKDVLDT